MTLSLDSPLLRIFLTVSFFAALSLVRTKDVDIPYLYKISCWHYWYVWNWQQHILYSSVSAACGYSPSDKCSHWVLWKRYARWRRLIFFETDRTVTYPNRFLFWNGFGISSWIFSSCYDVLILFQVFYPLLCESSIARTMKIFTFTVFKNKWIRDYWVWVFI